MEYNQRFENLLSSFNLAKNQSAEQFELDKFIVEVDELKNQLNDLDVELKTLKLELGGYELEYAGKLGSLYAELDNLQLRIDEYNMRIRVLRQRGATVTRKEMDAEVEQKFAKRRAEAKERAEQAREAKETLESKPLRQLSEEDFATLKEIYHRMAKKFHPDLADSEESRQANEWVMRQINEAYSQGDIERLLQIENLEDPATEPDESIGEKIVRMIRRREELDRIIGERQKELERIKKSETYKLKTDVESAAAEGRDLFDEIADKIRQQIETKQHEADQAVATFKDLAAETGFDSGRLTRGERYV